jgi:hypothetical protein
MNALEERATRLRMRRLHLDTATNQPEAMAFYESLCYQEVNRETRPDWWWTLVHYVKAL